MAATEMVPGSVNGPVEQQSPPNLERKRSATIAGDVPASLSRTTTDAATANPNSFMLKTKKGLGLHHSNTLALPPCTVWIGNLPREIASTGKLKGFIEQKFGEVETVTVRTKETPDRSWAFLTFVEPESMTECLEAKTSVYDNYLGKTVELSVRLPWSQDHQGSNAGGAPGAMRKVARAHKTRTRWAAVSGSVAGRKAPVVSTRGLGEMMMDTHRRQQAERRKCFFMPQRTFRAIWDAAQLVILMYVALVYPVRAAMEYDPELGSWMMVLDVIIDLWFLLDIVINFRTAYKNEEDETIVVDLKKIAHRYVCGFRSGGGWFFVDLISSLPIQYIAMISGRDEANESGVQIRLFKVLRLVRLARLLRLIRIRALTRQYEDTALFDVFESLKLVHMTFLIMWMAHIAACVWYYVGTVDQTVTTSDGNETIYGWVHTEYGPASGNERSEDKFRAYLMALHAVNPKMYDLNDAVSGDFTTLMLLASVLLETLGLVGFGVVIGSLSTYISSGKQEHVKYKQKMDTLGDFFRAKEVPFELRKNVRLFYDNLLRKKTVFDESEIIASLPPALANDVIYSLYSETITSSPIFVGLEVEVVAKLCMRLTPFHALSGMVISQEGHQGTEVYIVQKGEVLISRGGVHLAVIGPGSSFGEMSALGFSHGKNGNKRDKTATAVTEADLVFITGEQLYDLMEDYDSLRTSLRSVVEKRMKDRRKTRRKSAEGKLDKQPDSIRNKSSHDATQALSKRDLFAQELSVTTSNVGAQSASSTTVLKGHGGQTVEPEKLQNDSPKQGVVTSRNDAEVADILNNIDQKLNALVQEQSGLTHRVAEMERSMTNDGTAKGFVAPITPKFNVSQCARQLMASSANRPLGSLPSLAGGMGLSDGLGEDNSSSDDDEDDGRRDQSGSQVELQLNPPKRKVAQILRA